ncbi:hypothetical protein CC1G_03090 [Coprinopsis cinerea okayama7|uniref:FAD/NAD(P)-binding domain-containing protein n=1 Tax=Coprinopsis cinerea (strain Okayama-7 / 130 / ATCC MYA-4618 / FGSC 9003) TaxID=240176 RepID=A8PEW6_COPC7|nr:hypothetical protein CC1G_03090 [Coprinopsis cinerea okayama7\|eukprot:XP_001840861.1 hypothetical protein CC1G_03090 [Coprinopsis cinerea okayama7\
MNASSSSPTNSTAAEVKSQSICIIGAGPAGLITAHTLLQDGFSDVTVYTKDEAVGGVWARQRVYPGMNINNVHGQFRFSALEMPPPPDAHITGGRLRGEDMCNYFERFYERFLKRPDHEPQIIHFKTEVTRVRRGPGGAGWRVELRDVGSGTESVKEFERIVICTGGCNTPQAPSYLTPSAALEAGFEGPVVHSSESWTEMERILKACGKADSTEKEEADKEGMVVVVGGGKSAQDIAAHLANIGVKVTIVFSKADMFLAAQKPVNPRIRQSRVISVLSPSVELRSRTERFLHTTWLGGKIVRGFWDGVAKRSFKTYNFPPDHPLSLHSHNVFWGNRTGDEGVRSDKTFQSHVLSGRIQCIVPGYVLGFRRGEAKEQESAGSYLLLDSGDKLYPSAVIVATGYKSSWEDILDEESIREIGLIHDVPPERLEKYKDEWKYTSLKDAPLPLSEKRHGPSASTSTSTTTLGKERVGDSKPLRAPALYKGMIPAKSLLKRDVAVNGAMITANSGYAFELAAHWISSYFLGEPMRLPRTVEEAEEETVRNLAWMMKRFPHMDAWKNGSHGSWTPHFAWPQGMDALLEDMYLPSWRSGGNWLTWILKPIRIEEIANLGEERRRGVESGKRERLSIKDREQEERRK